MFPYNTYEAFVTEPRGTVFHGGPGGDNTIGGGDMGVYAGRTA